MRPLWVIRPRSRVRKRSRQVTCLTCLASSSPSLLLPNRRILRQSLVASERRIQCRSRQLQLAIERQRPASRSLAYLSPETCLKSQPRNPERAQRLPQKNLFRPHRRPPEKIPSNQLPANLRQPLARPSQRHGKHAPGRRRQLPIHRANTSGQAHRATVSRWYSVAKQCLSSALQSVLISEDECSRARIPEHSSSLIST